MRDHFTEVMQREDERTSLHKLRKFTGWYTHGLPDGRHLRRQLSELATASAVMSAVDAFFAERSGRLMPARLPMPLTAELHLLTPDVPTEVFGDAFRAACERLDRFIGALARSLARDLDLEGRPPPGRRAPCWPSGAGAATAASPSSGCSKRSSSTATRPGSGPAGTSPRRSMARPPSRSGAEAIAAMPATEPAYRVLELSAAALPSVLAGTTRGEDALFGLVDAWPVVRLLLQLEPPLRAEQPSGGHRRGAHRHDGRPDLRGRRRRRQRRPGGPRRVGRAEGCPPTHYTFTELQPAFLRRGGRAVQAALPPGCGLATLRYDVNLDPASQGVARGQFDLVVAVNTLHLAQDTVQALAHLRTLLAPGGALVLGELVRPQPLAPVHLELPFTMLEAYRRAPLADGIRLRPGFMSFTGWTRAARDAGFGTVSLLPAELEYCAQVYPGFYCAAITAR